MVKLRAGLFLAGIFLLISACSARPVPGVLIPISADLKLNTHVTDYDALVYAHGVKQILGGRAHRAERGDIAAALGMAGLSTGSTIAGASGATSGAITAIVAVGSLISNLASAVNPALRANALSEGANLVLLAEGKYFMQLTGAGIRKVSRAQLTPYGAMLIADVNGAVAVANRLLMSLLPDSATLKSIKESKVSGNISDAVREAINGEAEATVP